MTSDQANNDLDWLMGVVGAEESAALELMIAADWAEMQRLIDIFGYPKDNADTPPLIFRLQSSKFASNVREALDERQDLIALLDRAVEMANEANGQNR